MLLTFDLLREQITFKDGFFCISPELATSSLVSSCNDTKTKRSLITLVCTEGSHFTLKAHWQRHNIQIIPQTLIQHSYTCICIDKHDLEPL